MQNIIKRVNVAAAVLLTVGAVSLAPQSSHADLSMTGATGLTINPTAEMPDAGSVQVQAGYYVLGDNFGGNFHTFGVHAATRLRNTPLEINGGVRRLHVRKEEFPGATGNLEGDGLDFGAKYLVTGADDPDAVRVAVGAGYSRAFFDNLHFYAVASKPVGHFLNGRPPIAAHLGARHDRYRSNDETSKRASIYGGLEIPLDRSGTYSFAGELQSKNHRLDVPRPNTTLLYSYALRYNPPNRPYYASFGIERQGVLSDSSLFAYVGYEF